MDNYDPDDLKILFSLFDADRDGKIGKGEITELISFIAGRSAENNDIAEFMHFIDTNKDGVISIDEFEVLVSKYFKMIPLGIRNLFNTFDLNGDGFVDPDELNRVVKDKIELFNEQQINFFKRVLTRDNGEKVSYQEFINSSLEHYRNYISNRDDCV